MKKVVCVLLAAVMCLAVTGCGGAGNGRPAQTNQGKSVNDVLSEKINEGDQTKEDSPAQSRDDTGSVNGTVNDIPVDVDLTQLSSTMVYSEVYNMMTEPDSYRGKSIRMKGTFAYSVGKEGYYLFCVIADATACCAQGMEFVLKEDRKFPDEYPPETTEITVVGTFDTYMEDSFEYCHLINAVME